MGSKSYVVDTFGSCVRIALKKSCQNYIRKLRQINLWKIRNKTMKLEPKSHAEITFGRYVRITLQNLRQNYLRKLRQIYVRELRNKTMQIRTNKDVMAYVIITKFCQLGCFSSYQISKFFNMMLVSQSCTVLSCQNLN